MPLSLFSARLSLVLSCCRPSASAVRRMVALVLVLGMMSPTLALAGTMADFSRPLRSHRKINNKANTSTALPASIPSSQTTLNKHVEARDNSGTDFWLLAPVVTPESSSITLLITADADTSGKISVPGMEFTMDFSVKADALTTINHHPARW